VKTFKQTPTSPAGGNRCCGSRHGATPHNTPLARKAVGTFFAQQQQQIGQADDVQPASQELASSSDSAAAPGGPQIIHLSYGTSAPFKGVPSTSRVAAVAHQLEKHCRVDNNSDGSAAGGQLPGTDSGMGAPHACGGNSSDGPHDGAAVSTSDVLQSAATPAVSIDGMNTRLLPPSRKPQVVAARLSSITLEGAKVALERTASAEVGASLASDSGQNMNPLYRPSSRV
jgi:hypothetical protein